MSAIDIQLAGGLVMLLLMLWQLSTGLRWIKVGKRTFKIHKWTGVTLAVFALPHLINGLRIAGVLKF